MWNGIIMLMDNALNNNFEGAAVVPEAAPVKKNNSKLLIMMVLGLLIGAFGASAILVGINGGFDFGKKENVTKTSSDDEKSSANDNYSDEKLRLELAYKTNLVLSNGLNAAAGNTSRYNYFSSPAFTLSSYANLSAEQKMGIIIGAVNENSALTQNQIANVKPNEIEIIKKDLNNDDVDLSKGYIAVKDSSVSNLYRYVFGSYGDSLPEKADSSMSSSCYRYWHIESINSYIASTNCGDGGGSLMTDIKQYKIEIEESKASVYFVAMTNTEPVDETAQEYFGDLDCTVKINGTDSVDISENNDKLTRYRAIFEKAEDGNFIYKAMEKVK